MHRRLTPARYNNPVIREHLVSQYLLGTLPIKVRRRLESLMANDITWYGLVIKWHSRLSGLEVMSPSHPPSWVWNNIDTALGKQEKTHWGARWWGKKWPAFSLVCSVTLLLLSSFMLLFMSEQKIATPSYIAVMSSAEKNDYFVLMAYKGDKPGKSSMGLKWNTRHHLSEINMKTAMLWAKDKNTGQMTLLGRFVDLQSSKLLTPTEWITVKNSSELFITENNNPESKVLFKGNCIELSVSPT